jgi:hypothetical protein
MVRLPVQILSTQKGCRPTALRYDGRQLIALAEKVRKSRLGRVRKMPFFE